MVDKKKAVCKTARRAHSQKLINRKYFNTLYPYYKFPENVINQEELNPLAKGLRLWVRLFQSAFYTYVLVLLYVLTYLPKYVLYE